MSADRAVPPPLLSPCINCPCVSLCTPTPQRSGPQPLGAECAPPLLACVTRTARRDALATLIDPTAPSRPPAALAAARRCPRPARPPSLQPTLLCDEGLISRATSLAAAQRSCECERGPRCPPAAPLPVHQLSLCLSLHTYAPAQWASAPRRGARAPPSRKRDVYGSTRRAGHAHRPRSPFETPICPCSGGDAARGRPGRPLSSLPYGATRG